MEVDHAHFQGLPGLSKNKFNSIVESNNVWSSFPIPLSHSVHLTRPHTTLP